MKKLLVSVVALATVITFTSCGDDEKAPEITLPTDATTLVIDLGDETKAKEGVTAKDDKDGDVTNSLTIVGLDYVGNGGLTYYAKDNANNEGKATRPATITATKLTNKTYKANEVGDDGSTDTYDVTVVASSSNIKVVINNFYGANYTATFAGDGASQTMIMEPVELEDGVITGSISYTKSGDNYVFTQMKYKATPTAGDVVNYTTNLTVR